MQNVVILSSRLFDKFLPKIRITWINKLCNIYCLLFAYYIIYKLNCKKNTKHNIFCKKTLQEKDDF